MCVRARERAGGRAQREEARRARLGWLSCLLLSHGEGGREGGGRYLGASFWLCACAIKKKIGCVGGCWSGLSARAAVRAAASCVRACARARFLARAALCVCGSGTSVHGACVHVVAAAPPPSFFSLPHTDTDWGPRERPRGRARPFEERDRRRKGQKGGVGVGGQLGPWAAPPLLFLCVRPLPRTLLLL